MIKKEKLSTSTLTLVALMTAVICMAAPFTIPIGPIPISLATLVLYFAAYVLGWKKGCLACLLYLLIGFVGIPVFSGFSGGVGKLFGPTGGYLIGYILFVWITGWFAEKFSGKKMFYLLGMICGTGACYAVGTVWFIYVTSSSISAAFTACILPFIPADLIKMGVAAVVAPSVRGRLVKAGYLKVGK